MTPQLIEIVKYIERNPGRTSSDISQRFELIQLDARNKLAYLCSMKYLKSEKQGGVYYFYSNIN